MPRRAVVCTLAMLAAPMVALARQPVSEFDRMIERETRGHPAQVKAFVDRQIACNHFSGEFSGNEARDEQVRQAVKDLNCGRLEADERKLARRFPRSASVMRRAHDWQP